jgi:predicted nucleic acid-binding Zn ribbon protein
MERAARLINKNKFSREIFSDDDVTRAIWPQAVGKAIATHTCSLKLVRATLVVEVEDATWQRQLHALSAQILNRLHKISGSNSIEHLEFRIATPRRQPQRADSPRPAPPCDPALLDEADAIQDPVLKKVYRLSRRKVTA